MILMLLAFRSVVHAQAPNYEEHVKPLFRDHCLKCHNSDESNADLDLSSFAAVMKGGSSGAVVNAGRPESSQLYRAISHLENAEAMPPESPKLPEAKIAIVRDWIRGGLIAGKGGTSLLRSVGAMLTPVKPGSPAPLPENLLNVALAKVIRPPIPQAIAASPGAPLFAVSGQEQILLYGSMNPRPEASRRMFAFLGALPFPEGTIHDLKFSRNGSLILAAGGRGAHSGRVVLFDVKTGKRVAEIGDEVESVLAADISANHDFVALGGPDKLVKVFRTSTGEIIHKIDKHTDWVTAMSFSPDGSLLATGDRSGGVHVWETEKGAIVFTLDEHKVRITDLAWRADSKLLASVAEDGNLILWDMKDGFPSRNIVAHASKESPRYSRRTGVTAVNFAPDGRLMTVGRDGFSRVWSVDGEKLSESRIEGGIPTAAAVLNSGAAAVVGSFDGSLSLWDLTANARTQTLVNGQDDPE
jgi:hypothetical protein